MSRLYNDDTYTQADYEGDRHDDEDREEEHHGLFHDRRND